MTQSDIRTLRVLAVCGHGSSGKTSLVDRVLFKTGASASLPSVDDGTSVCDFDPEEKKHKHTIDSSIVHCDYGGHRLQIVDTPGYADFLGQTIGAIAGVDCALIAVNAHSGIEVNTRRVFKEAEQAGVGRFIVLTKLDTDNVDFPALVASIREIWGPRCLPLNVPVGSGESLRSVIDILNPTGDASEAPIDVAEWRERLLETIVEVDDAAMERYFEGEEPTDEALDALMARAVACGTLIPILSVSARQDVGVDELLDAIIRCAPSPADVQRADWPDVNGEFSARVFKTRIDPFVQKLSFLRVFSGQAAKDQSVAVSGARKAIKLGQLLRVQGEHTEPIAEAQAGEIVAVAKQDELTTGDSLGQATYPPIPFPLADGRTGALAPITRRRNQALRRAAQDR